MAAGVQIACAYSETMGSYGTVQVDNNLTASHTPSTADANDTFVIENGKLKVTTASANGTDYTLNNGRLTVNNGFTGTITSTAAFTSSAQTREIDYTYDHNGLRTGKVVTENGSPEYTKYTLHGKMITHITKLVRGGKDFRVSQRLHFYYDAQSRPAFVEYNGMKYRYLQNLQGDIVGIVDNIGNLVVEYKYDAWGKPISITGSMADTLGKQNPFRYRGYVYDEETDLYYLRNRYYNSDICRFLNVDAMISSLEVIGLNVFVYCSNTPIGLFDPNGTSKRSAISNFIKSTLAKIKQFGTKVVNMVKSKVASEEYTKQVDDYFKRCRMNTGIFYERLSDVYVLGNTDHKVFLITCYAGQFYEERFQYLPKHQTRIALFEITTCKSELSWGDARSLFLSIVQGGAEHIGENYNGLGLKTEAKNLGYTKAGGFFLDNVASLDGVWEQPIYSYDSINMMDYVIIS